MKEEVRRQFSHELKEVIFVFLFLALFFSAFVAYSYGTALVLAKVIWLGEFAHLDRHHEGSPLIVSALYKSLVFGPLAAAFRLLEEGIKHLVFRRAPFHPFESRNRNEFLAHALVMFCVFIPFFSFREAARVLGESNLYELFFRGRSVPDWSPDLAGKPGR